MTHRTHMSAAANPYSGLDLISRSILVFCSVLMQSYGSNWAV